MRPHTRQPIRLPHPWDSPGKNNEVGRHFLLQCMKVKSERKVTQSCPTSSDPMDCSLPGSSIHGIFQARVLDWGAIAWIDIYTLLSIYANYRTSKNLLNSTDNCYNRFYLRTYSEKAMAPQSSTLAWKIPWTEEPGRLQTMGSRRVTTERLHFHFSLSCIGEGNGNPLQCSCLENPRDRGAWWAAVYGVSQSRTQLK